MNLLSNCISSILSERYSHCLQTITATATPQPPQPPAPLPIPCAKVLASTFKQIQITADNVATWYVSSSRPHHPQQACRPQPSFSSKGCISQIRFKFISFGCIHSPSSWLIELLMQCPTGAACSAGTCLCLSSGQGLCNGACPDYQSDVSNCGSCGNKVLLISDTSRNITNAATVHRWRYMFGRKLRCKV
jgi:hypothetical protein